MATDDLLTAAPAYDLLGARTPDAEAALLRTMREQFRQAEEAESTYRREALDDLRFRGGEQWAPLEKQRRIAMGRPCLTVNTLPQYERQVTNEARQNKPSIRVLPVGNGADVKTAKTLQGLCRHIEQASHADVAYQTAFEAAVRHGRGYFRLCLDYEDPMSFEQHICIARIRNPFMVYMDPGAQLPTYADANWGFTCEQMPREVFQEQWGVDAQSMGFWSSQGDSWILRDQVRIAEYFWRDTQRMTLAQLVDGQTVLLEPTLLAPMEELENPEPLQRFVAHLLTPRPRYVPLLPWLRQQAQTVEAWLDGLPVDFVASYAALLRSMVQQVRQVRPTTRDTIRWVKTNGHVILEESIWPGKWIPIIPLLGEELDINNQVMLSGIIRHAKDPMRMVNYWITMQAEHVALSPVPPWLVAAGQVEDFEEEWKSANRMPRAYLPYNPLDLNGHPVPPPTRNQFEPPIQAITLALQTTEQYSESTMGIYRGNVGAPSKERSGRAIAEKDRQSDTGMYHYADNLARAIQFTGEQLIDLIPKILTPGRVQRILGDDGSPQQVLITQDGQVDGQPVQEDLLPEGIAGVFDLATGTYDVIAELGPSYATKREEAASQMLELTRALPDVMRLAIDKLVGTMDWEGASEIAERLRKTLPPELLDEETRGQPKPEQQLQQLKAAMQQLQQQLEALNAYASEAEQAKTALEQQNAQLTEQLASKRAGLVLDQAELAEERRAEQAKLALEAAKLDWEKEKFYLTFTREGARRDATELDE